MKINPIAKLKRSIQSASLISKILFILCCSFFVIWLISSRIYSLNYWLILTGLLGVLWLSSIALHSFKRHGAAGQKRNPFTPLIAMCMAVAVLCYGIGVFWEPTYSSASEPINWASDRLQEHLDEFGPQLARDYSGFLMEYPMNGSGTNTNLILTDENNKVLYREDTWLIGEHETLRALLCPATYETGTGFMILVDESESVVAAFQVDSGYFGESASGGYSSLTIKAKSAEETEEESGGDSLYERYFPSFGTTIDQAAIELALNTLGIENMDGTYSWIDVQNWGSEPIAEIGFSDNPAALVRELNALTAAERKELKEYLAWLESALSAAQKGAGDNNHPYRARILTSSDGSATLYMLYEYDSDALFPNRHRYLKALEICQLLHYLVLLMIPAIIVFLAFWVFVDAKKRGQSTPSLWAVLTLIGNVVAWIIYMLVRPQMAVGVTGQQMPKGVCPICGTKLRSDFIACPGCGILLRNRCKNCGKALENDWSFCPYCTNAIGKGIEGETEEE